MKVWIIEISDFLPYIDGDNRLYRAGMLAKAMVERGHKVLWWTSTFNHQLRKQRFNESTTIDIEPNYSLRLLYGPGYKSSISIHRMRHNRIIARMFASEINHVLENERPDLIYACLPTLEVSEKAILYGVRYGIPVVVDIRDKWPEIYLSPFPEFLRPVVKLLFISKFIQAYRILNKAKSILAISESNLKWGLGIAKKEIGPYDKWFPLGYYAGIKKNIMPNGEDAEKLKTKYGIGNGSLVITFVGSFSPSYDFHTVLNAARILLQLGEKRVMFIIVGNGEQEAFLKEKSKKLNNVILAGWCKKSEIEQILAISSVGLAPYKLQAMMTLPNKPFEYMAAGIPILSSLNGECRQLLEKESIGLHYVSDNSTDLKEKILWFLSHTKETKAMGIRARSLFKEQFSANTIYPKMAKHLEYIAQNRAN